VTTQPDPAAIAEAKVEALAAIDGVTKSLQAADKFRAQRDAAILKMHQAGESIPDISRDLGFPASTIRHAIRSALVRASAPN
jgi:DNA-binding NarL/FixJ family response regulator